MTPARSPRRVLLALSLGGAQLALLFAVTPTGAFAKGGPVAPAEAPAARVLDPTPDGDLRDAMVVLSPERLAQLLDAVAPPAADATDGPPADGGPQAVAAALTEVPREAPGAAQPGAADRLGSLPPGPASTWEHRPAEAEPTLAAALAVMPDAASDEAPDEAPAAGDPVQDDDQDAGMVEALLPTKAFGGY